MAIINEELLNRAIEAGQAGLDRAIGAADQDFMQLAQEKTDLLRGMLEPEQERQRKALEARLLAQGRLGSTGGSEQQAALERAIGQQDLQAQLAGLELANQARMQDYQMGLGLAEFGGGMSAREAGLGLERDQLALAREQFEWQKRRDRRKGGFLSGLLGGLAPAIGTAIGGPIGGAIGSSVAGIFGGNKGG